ncbi:MAG: biopolymer transporter ExbD [Alkalinema sp. FL-bin-369]|nr:biopolymer transporter ExbD [Leptolyngbyaceae cyanobacterium LF-bin-369]
MPEPNLVPMMDVVLTVLMFFIVLSMAPKAKMIKNVALPSADRGRVEEVLPDPLIIGMNKQGQNLVDNQPIDDLALGNKVVEYLNKNAKGAVVLKADKGLSYEKVIKTLGILRDVGGDRVSLALE